MGGQFGFCAMGSFIIFDRSGKFKDAKKGNYMLSAIVDCENIGFWLGMGFVCDIPGCVFCWLPKWVALLCPLVVVGGVVCGDPGGVSTSVALGDPWGFPTINALRKDKPIRAVMFHL